MMVLLQLVIKGLFDRKMRTFLTSLSIIIGVASIFALMSFGQGLTAYVAEVASSVGADKLIIQPKGIGPPGSDSAFSLTQDDVRFVSKINGVTEAVGMYYTSAEVEMRNTKKYVYAMGSDVGEHKRLVDEVSKYEKNPVQFWTSRNQILH